MRADKKGARDGVTGRTKLGIAAAVALILIALAAWRIEAASARILTARYPQPDTPLALPPSADMAAEGERLVHLDGCTSCHGEALTGRVIFSGSFGTRLVAPNLTALPRHRSNAQLAAAIRYGVKPDGTSLIDMPVAKFLRSSDGDIAAIIAYLRSLPQRPDAAGKTQWGFGGRAMLAMGLIKVEARRLDRSQRGPKQTPGEPMARGRYLTQVYCSGCHGADLGGNPEEYSPDLRFAIKHYSPAVFARFFTTGVGRKGHGTHTMTPMIKSRFRHLTKADVRAIFVYLNNSKAAK